MHELDEYVFNLFHWPKASDVGYRFVSYHFPYCSLYHQFDDIFQRLLTKQPILWGQTF